MNLASPLDPYSGAQMDLGLGAQAQQQTQDEIDRIKKKKLEDQKAGDISSMMTPNSAAFLSLSGNQF